MCAGVSKINPNPFTTRPELDGTFGVVASTHWIATAIGMATKIECPILICHGSGDLLSPPSIAQQLYDHAGSRDKTLKIFTREEGGDQHVQVDNRQIGIDYIGDWLATRL